MNDIPEHEGEIIKRSVMLAGHRTSISLERAFWDELKDIAARRNLSINQLVSDVDQDRKGNLSSALRVYILSTLRANSGG